MKQCQRMKQKERRMRYVRGEIHRQGCEKESTETVSGETVRSNEAYGKAAILIN